MQRAVKSLKPFDFRSDFTLQPEPEMPALPVEEKITLSAPDLAMLLTEARAEAHAAAMSIKHDEQNARLQQVTENLTDALANLVSLAGHLESSAYSDGFRESALRLVTIAAQRIVDGQGDLFAQNQEFSQKSRPTDKDGS
ncbi:hypothetical protein [Hyphomonas sp.]|uniref:hypothetical protein n=1 Tax=Hyphomonas sp. TaxID=87 RepID=UPI0035292425